MLRLMILLVTAMVAMGQDPVPTPPARCCGHALQCNCNIRTCNCKCPGCYCG